MAFTITVDGDTSCLDMNFTGAVDPTINLSSFTLEISGGFTAITGLTVAKGTSLIKMIGNTKVFTGAGKTYNNLESTGTPITIVDDNTFNDLKGTPDKTIKFTTGSTQTITSLSGAGSAGHLITIESTSAGTHYHLVSASNQTVNYWSIKDNYVSGVGSFKATNSTNVSGNNGWIFGLGLYWIGRTGNWSDITKWSYSSGGAAAGVKPTEDDIVYFDANSFNGASQIVTVDEQYVCKSMDWTGATNTPEFTKAAEELSYIYENLTLIADMVVSGYAGYIAFVGTSTGYTITTAAKTLYALLFSAAGEWTLVGNLYLSRWINLEKGTFKTGNYAIVCGGFTTDGTLTREINLGSSVVTNSGNWSVLSATGLTIAPGTSLIKMTGASKTFTGGSLAYYDLDITGDLVTIVGNNTYHDLKLNLDVDSSVTDELHEAIPSIFTLADRIVPLSEAVTSEPNGAGTIFYRDTDYTINYATREVILIGVVSDTYWSYSSIECAEKTFKFTAGSTQVVSSLSGGGTETCQVIIESTSPGNYFSISKATGYVNVGFYSITDSHAITTGDAIFNTTSCYDGGGNTGWVFCAYKLLTITFDTDIECLDLICSMPSGLYLDLAESTLNVSGNFNMHSSVSITPGTSLIKMLGDNKIFTGGGKTYHDIEFLGTPITIIGSNTFNILTLHPDNTLALTSGTTQTLTTLDGTGTEGHMINLEATTVGAHASISISTGTVIKDYWSIKDNYAIGGADFYATNSDDLTGNSGWTFSGATSNRFWVGGSGSVNDIAHWATSSGGAGGKSVPSSISDVYFDDNSFTVASYTVTVNIPFSCKNMDWTGALHTPSWDNQDGNEVSIYGDFTLNPVMNLTGLYGGAFSFKSTETNKQITTNGQTLYAVTFYGTGKWILQDALDVTSYIDLVQGEIDTNGEDISAHIIQTDGVLGRTFDLGNSLITCTGDWLMTSTTNLTFEVDTCTIAMTGASHTFVGGDLTYNDVDFSGDLIEVYGSNTYSDLKLHSGNTTLFELSQVQTFITLTGDGILGDLIYIRSTVDGFPFTFSCATGTLVKNFYDIKDSTATGGAVFRASRSINSGNNLGWIFKDIDSWGTLTLNLSAYTRPDMTRANTETDVIPYTTDAINAIDTVLLTAGNGREKRVVEGWAIKSDYDTLESDYDSYVVKTAGFNDGTSISSAIIWELSGKRTLGAIDPDSDERIVFYNMTFIQA